MLRQVIFRQRYTAKDGELVLIIFRINIQCTKYLVAAVLCVGFILAVCDAGCFLEPPPKLKSDQKTLSGCVFGGKLHELGSQWITEDCMDCSCSSDGSVGCCGKLDLPMPVDRNRCGYIEDMKTCTWRLVSNEDPTKDCY
ncbi:beta-microseminoprotein-like [Lithobates pipiens]